VGIHRKLLVEYHLFIASCRVQSGRHVAIDHRIICVVDDDVASRAHELLGAGQVRFDTGFFVSSIDMHHVKGSYLFRAASYKGGQLGRGVTLEELDVCLGELAAQVGDRGGRIDVLIDVEEIEIDWLLF